MFLTSGTGTSVAPCRSSRRASFWAMFTVSFSLCLSDPAPQQISRAGFWILWVSLQKHHDAGANKTQLQLSTVAQKHGMANSIALRCTQLTNSELALINSHLQNTFATLHFVLGITNTNTTNTTNKTSV